MRIFLFNKEKKTVSILVDTSMCKVTRDSFRIKWAPEDLFPCNIQVPQQEYLMEKGTFSFLSWAVGRKQGRPPPGSEGMEFLFLLMLLAFWLPDLLPASKQTPLVPDVTVPLACFAHFIAKQQLAVWILPSVVSIWESHRALCFYLCNAANVLCSAKAVFRRMWEKRLRSEQQILGHSMVQFWNVYLWKKPSLIRYPIFLK